MLSGRFDYRITSMASAILVVIAAYGFYQELSVFANRPADDTAFSRAAGAGDLHPVFSSFSNQILMDDCLKSMRSLTGRLQPTEKKIAHFAGCRKLALDVASIAPAAPNAWYLAAAASGALGEEKPFFDYFKRSYDTSPREGWLARRRVTLLLRHQGLIREETRAILASDIRTLLNSFEDIDWLATRYVQYPVLREATLQQSQQISAQLKKHFLRHLHLKTQAANAKAKTRL